VLSSCPVTLAMRSLWENGEQKKIRINVQGMLVCTRKISNARDGSIYIHHYLVVYISASVETLIHYIDLRS